MSNKPAYIGIRYKEVDVFGWFMLILGLFCMYFMASSAGTLWYRIGGSLVILFLFAEYVVRVCWGTMYKVVYYDTINYSMFEVDISGEIKFISASSEEELALYLQFEYDGERYRIIEEHKLESFIKTEKYK